MPSHDEHVTQAPPIGFNKSDRGVISQDSSDTRVLGRVVFAFEIVRGCAAAVGGVKNSPIAAKQMVVIFFYS